MPEARRKQLDAQQEPAAPRSLWEQVNPISLASSAVQGVTALTKEVVKAPFIAAQLAPDIARNLGVPLPGESRTDDMDWSGNMFQDWQAFNRAYAPLGADISSSVWRTADVLGATGPNAIERYRTAVDEGRWVDEVFQDVGNVALVAGPVSRALGTVAGGTALPGQGSALMRAAARGRAGETTISAAAERALPSGYVRASTLPGRLDAPARVTLRVPSEAPTLLRLRQAASDIPPSTNYVRGTGLAGMIERSAMPGASPGELFAARSSATQSISSQAQSLANAGNIVGKVGLGAQWIDPMQSLVGMTEQGLKLSGRGLARVTRGNGDVPSRVSSSLDNAARRIEEYRNQSDMRQDYVDQRSEIEKAAARAQFYVEENLSRLNKRRSDLELNRQMRDYYGGIILDSTDRALDTYADMWDRLAPQHRAAALRSWNAMRAKPFELTAERLDLYNQYRRNELDPEATAILREGLDQLQSDELIRREYQTEAGNLDPEQTMRPQVRTEDGALIDYNDVSPAELAVAMREGRVEYPWIARKTVPELEARQLRLAEAQQKLAAHQETMVPLRRELDTVAQQRSSLPKPGRNVPYDDTPHGRAELIAEQQARIDQLGEPGPEPGAWSVLAGERLSVAEAAANDAARAVERSILQSEMPDPYIGTNPMDDRMWAGGTWGEGTYPREEVIRRQIEDKGVYGEPLHTRAEDVIRRDQTLRDELKAAETREWQLKEDVKRAEDRVNNFYNELNESQQHMVKEVARNGAISYRQVIKSHINPKGRKIGGWALDPKTKQPRLTGYIAEVANKLGMYDRVLAEVDRFISDTFAKPYETYRKNYVGTDPMSFDKFVEWALRREGFDNIAYSVLRDHADRLATGTTFDTWKNTVGELERAYVADILTRQINRFIAEDSPGSGHAAYTATLRSFEELPENLRRHIGNDAFDALHEAYNQHRKRYHAEVQASINRSMSYVPAPFRTPLQEARRAVAGFYRLADEEWGKGTAEGRAVAEMYYRMAEQAPTSLAMYVESNGTVPIHLIAGDGSGYPRRPRRADAPAEVVAPTPRGARERLEGQRVPTLREYASIEAREMTQIAAQRSVMYMAMHPRFSRSVAEVPGVAEALAEWASRNDRPMTMDELRELVRDIDPDQEWAIVSNATEATTRDVRGKLASLRFNKPARDDMVMTTGETAPGVRRDQVIVTDPQTGRPIMVEYDQLTELNRIPEIRVVPAYLSKVLDDHLNPTSNRFLVMYDQMTQLWKTATLAWSVAWVTYNAIGNALMATFSYGQSPVDLVKNIGMIRDQLRALNVEAGLGAAKPLRTAMKYDTLSSLVPTRMGAHGPSWAERLATSQLADDSTRLGKVLDYVSSSDKSWIGKVTEFSYTLNEFTDNMFRTSVLMEDLHKRLLREAPLDPEWLNPDGSLRGDLSPEQQAKLTDVSRAADAALNNSVRAALNTMGDFTRLNRFERNVVKRIFPFYPWIRHQTAMAVRMPLTNPMRWMWMQSLSDLLADPEMGEEMNQLMAGFIGSPMGMIPISAANPFGKGITGFGSQNLGSSLLDPQSMMAAVNPIPKTAASLITGIDFNQGATLTRPPDQKSTNDYGQEISGSALTRLQRDPIGGIGEIGYSVLGLTPQTRGLHDAALGPQPRYDSGDVISYADDRPGGRILPLGRAARLPFLPTDITYLQEVAQAKDDEAAKAARRRALRLAAASSD